MKCTELYLEEDLLQALQAQAANSGTSISELASKTLRERYKTKPCRKEAMTGIVGIWSDRKDLPDTETYVRQLRSDGDRWELFTLNPILIDSDILCRHPQHRAVDAQPQALPHAGNHVLELIYCVG